MADFSRITERLFCGGQIKSAADVVELVGAGVTHIINAQHEFFPGAIPPMMVFRVRACSKVFVFE